MSDSRDSNSNSNNNDHNNNNGKQKKRRQPHILLGVTGSVAAIKAPEIANRLVLELDAQVRVLLTAGGRNFWNKAHEYDAASWKQTQTLLLLEKKTKNDSESDSPPNRPLLMIHDPEEEWREWKRIGDPVLHIDLRNWADILLIAPLSAHTLAKLANGLCDDTLSCVVRAWKFEKSQPLIVAPAMNTAMWEHPLTRQQLEILKDFSSKRHDGPNDDNNDNNRAVVVIAPQVKTLACGDIGDGALASVESIVNTVRQMILLAPPLPLDSSQATINK